MGLLLGKAFCKIAETNDKKTRFSCIPERANVVKKVYEYVENPNEYQKLNVYSDSTRLAKSPALIDIHGGGWYYGDKDLNESYDTLFVTKGFTVISVGYSLVDKTHSFVDQVRDTVLALNWIKANAEMLNIDLDNVFAMGDSAGAQILGLIINLSESDEMKKVFAVSPELSFNAVNFTCGAFKMSFMASIPVLRSFVKPIIGKGFKKSTAYKYFNAIDNLPSTYPPAHFITCDGDFLKKIVLETKKVFDESGFETSLTCITKKQVGKKLSHVFNIMRPDDEISMIANNATAEFFKKYIK